MKTEKARLSPCALGAAIGVVWGISVMLITYFYMWHGEYGEVIVEFLEELYPWYNGDSLLCGLVGFSWGLLDGFVFGLLIGLVYNKVLGCCCKK